MTHLPYALAKELKNAGWPQPDFESKGTGQWIDRESSPDGYFPHPQYHIDNLFTLPRGEYVYSPSLDELIEGCPKFMVITPDPVLTGSHEASFVLEPINGQRFIPPREDYWRAAYLSPFGSGNYAEAATPKEAVARLWLALSPEMRVNLKSAD